MRKIFLMLVIVLYTTIMAFAENVNGKVRGILKGKSSHQPIEYATITLHKSETKELVTGALTDSIGHFFIENIPDGNYYLIGSYVGYKDFQSPPFIINTKQKTANLDVLWIDDSGEQLNEVIIEGHKSTFIQKLDKRVFNVGQDLMSSSGSASELMQNIPSVEVDMEGTVSLRGNENVTILINGKPSAMMNTKTRGDALQQLSANSIERIEIITNPSAQYKPDGVSGIINIIMKKESKKGLNGTLAANIGSKSRTNAGVNLNYHTGHINLFGGYSYRKDRYDRTIFDNRSAAENYINQTTLGVGHPTSHTFRLGIMTDITAHDAIEVSGNYNHRDFLRNERIESVTEDTNHNLSDFYFRNRSANAKENMWEGNFRYTHTYGKENEWGIEYTYSSESEDELNEYSTLQNQNRALDNEQVWDANYLHIGKFYWQHHLSDNNKLSVGYELENLTAEQNYHVQDWNGNAFIANQNRTSDFTHQRTIHSAYFTWEMDLGKWDLMVGIRGEQAQLHNKLLTIDSISNQHYANIYPTLHTSYRLNGHNNLQLNYSLRVNRPEGEDMNPFSEQINPLSLSAGNPNLKPEKIHSLEAGWLWHNDINASLMTTVYYRYLTNQITEVSHYMENDILLTTKENLESSHNAGIEAIWNYSFNKWMSFNWNANGYFNQINAENLGFGKHKNSFAWSMLLNTNITPFNHYMVQVNASWRSSTLVPQGHRNASWRINLGMKYDIPKINLSILTSISDLFDTYQKSYSLDTPELKQKVEKRRNPRIFYIGLSYGFGTTKNKKHNAELEYDENL